MNTTMINRAFCPPVYDRATAAGAKAAADGEVRFTPYPLQHSYESECWYAGFDSVTK